MRSKILKFHQEKFGGIVFNPRNGHELHLDHTLFNDLLKNKNNLKTKKIYENLELRQKDKIKKELFTAPKLKHNFPYQILNSPILADINITNKCNLKCPHCYINSKPEPKGKNMSFNDFQIALNACKNAGILQIALGGGEPTLHPEFKKILKEIHKSGIVPNLTSNGKELSWMNLYTIAKYCGAMALSLEGIYNDFEKTRNFSYTKFTKSIKKIKAAGIKLVFQITLGKNNINYIEKILNELLIYKPYGILFLAYKPQGRGKKLNLELSQIPQKILDKKIKNIFTILKNKTKLGFDCCCTPALINPIKSKSFIGCSASRYSLAIMPDLSVMPCSFLDQNKKYDNLKNMDLLNIWKGEIFDDFRTKIEKKMNSQKCTGCSEKNICLGGCPIFDLANCEQF